MKKLGITLLAAAFSVPAIFAAQTKPADSTATPQSKTATKTKAKNHKRRMHKKTQHNASQTSTTPNK